MESAVLHWVATYGYFAIFGLLVLGIVGIPVPDEFLLTGCGFLIYRGQLHAVPAFASAFGGSMCGITCSYLIGRTLGWKFLHSRAGRLLHIRDEQIRWVHDWFNRIGHWAFAYAGALMWVSAFLFIGYHFGPRWEEILRAIEHNLKEASVVGTVLIVAYCVFVYLKRRRPANS